MTQRTETEDELLRQMQASNTCNNLHILFRCAQGLDTIFPDDPAKTDSLAEMLITIENLRGTHRPACPSPAKDEFLTSNSPLTKIY